MNHSSKNEINRREAIKRTGYLLGGVIFAPNILGVLNGCTADRTGRWEPTLFSKAQAKLVTTLADVIMPRDNYPSASDVGVQAFIESMVSTVYSEEQCERFITGLDDFGSVAREALQLDYSESLDEDRYQFTYEQNQLALQTRNQDSNRDVPFFLMFKELTILGYFTSEAGATEVLRYEPVPGFYSGCMPFADIGKTWAT